MNRKNLIIGIISIVIIIVLVIVGFYFINSKNKNEVKNENNKENTNINNEQNEVIEENEEKDNLNQNKEENIMEEKAMHHAEISIKGYGTMELELDANNAPITVANFIKLAKEGFYEGLTFHRIISGFMIQGGDPLGNGTGGSKEEIKGEFLSNGVNNTISHKRGVISMARSMMPNSASSQFFIVHKDSPFLDGNYAAFGRVTKGIEIVDKICENTKIEADGESVAKENQPVIEKVTIID